MKKVQVQFGGNVIFDILLLVFLTTTLIVSFGYNPIARIFPLWLSLFSLVLVFLQILFDLFPESRKKLKFISGKGVVQAGSNQPSSGVRKPTFIAVFRIFVWMIMFIVILRYAGYFPAIVVFVCQSSVGNGKRSGAVSTGLGPD